MIGDIIYNDLNDTGRLEADGSLISEAGYPELFAILQQYHLNPEGLKDLVTGVPAFSTIVYAISQDANYVYVGGQFTGTNQSRFAVVRKSDWTLVSGVPAFSSTVYAISQDANYVYVGGAFTGTNQQYFAVVGTLRIVPAGFHPLPIIPPKIHNNITIPTQIQAEEI